MDFLRELGSSIPADRTRAAQRCGRSGSSAMAELPALLDAYEREKEWPRIPMLEALSRIVRILDRCADLGALVEDCMDRALAYLSPTGSMDLESTDPQTRCAGYRARGRTRDSVRAIHYAAQILRRLPFEEDLECQVEALFAVGNLADHDQALPVLARSQASLRRIQATTRSNRVRAAAGYAADCLAGARLARSRRRFEHLAFNQ